MARSIRIQATGAFYHVMARGNRREDIFHDDDDRRFFLHALSQACEMTGWRVHDLVLSWRARGLAGRAAVEADGGVARVAGGETADEISGEREPADEAAGPEAGAGQGDRGDETLFGRNE